MPEGSFVFDPRQFISPPYLDCPFCHASSEFGVLTIAGTGYVRRCRQCMKDERFQLPAIEKKVLYLDQFVVSNLMKVLHPSERERVRSRSGAQADFWLELFSRLDRLVKLQLLVCPSSTAHWEESLTTRFYEELRRMYEHLSGEVSFKDPETIRRFQVHRQFLAWLGEEDGRGPITIHDVTDGVLNRWLGRLSIRARMGGDAEFIDDLRTTRDRTHAGLAECVEDWAGGPRLGFEHYFEREISTYGPMQWHSYWQRIVKVGKMFEGTAALDPELVLAANEAQILVVSFKETLARQGLGHEEQLAKIAEFFASQEIKQALFLQISCAMFAAMAVEASMQQAPKPDQGMWTDIATVSTLLPYCDAMFIDKRCQRLLEAATHGAQLNYATKVFSIVSPDELLDWLAAIEASAGSEYVALVEHVYGDRWLEPYTSIFDAPA